MESLTEGRIVHYVDGDGFHRPALIVEVHRVLPETRKVEEARREERAAMDRLKQAEGQQTNTTKAPSGTQPAMGVQNPPRGETPETVTGTVTTLKPGDASPQTREAQVPSPAAALRPSGDLPRADQTDLVDLIVFHGVATSRPGGDGDHEFVQNAPRNNDHAKSVRGTWHFIE